MYAKFTEVDTKKHGKKKQCVIRVPITDSAVDTVRNYVFAYDDDTIRTFLIRAMEKAVDNRDYFEYTLFDDADDFRSVRTIIKER